MRVLTCAAGVAFWGLLALSPALAAPPGFVVETVNSGLGLPVAFAFAPDGRIFYNELNSGRVRVIENGSVVGTAFSTLSVSTSGERGRLGLALHPDFANNGFVYVCWSRNPSGHEIGRYTAVGNTGTNYTPIVTNLPSSGIHNGGNITFGPDGKLYHSMGDNANSGNSQNPSTYPGKIHRFNDDGSIPSDNPFTTGSLSRYCMGLRNSFDLCFNRTLGLLYASENGPGSDDEVNFIQAGNNYGWPTVSCSGGGAFTAALTCWTPTIAPTGITAYDASQFGPEYLHDLFMADFNTGRIWRLEMSPDGTTFVTRSVFHDEPGSVFDVVTGPDGFLYYSTGNSIRRIRRLIPVAPPLPFDCSIAGGEDTVLTWTNQGTGPGSAYDSIEIQFDGAPLVTLPGDAETYTHVDPPGGEHTYEIVAQQNGNDSAPESCMVTLSTDSVSNLVCSVNGTDASLSWTNEDLYTSVFVYRNGSFLIGLTGDATDYSIALTPGSYTFEVEGIIDNDFAPRQTCAFQVGSAFIRGDTNGDGGIDIADPVLLLDYSFGGGPAPSCLLTADMNSDGSVDVGDSVAILNYLFNMGPGSDQCVTGIDPVLDCASYSGCP